MCGGREGEGREGERRYVFKNLKKTIYMYTRQNSERSDFHSNRFLFQEMTIFLASSLSTESAKRGCNTG